MGFRYRRSINLGSGVRLNVSKRGISSVSVGRLGSTLNLGHRGVRATVGLPGTGLSYTTGSTGSGSIALVGLVATALGSLFWLVGAAARGNRLAQITLGALAVLVLFASLRSPESGRVSPTPATASAPAPSPVVAEAPPIVGPAAVSPTVIAGANISTLMKTTTGANVRSGPSPRAKVVRQLPAGALVEVIGGEGRWARVRTARGDVEGWVARSLLTLPDHLMSKLLTTDPNPKSPGTVFDPADISAMLNAAQSTR